MVCHIAAHQYAATPGGGILLHAVNVTRCSSRLLEAALHERCVATCVNASVQCSSLTVMSGLCRKEVPQLLWRSGLCQLLWPQDAICLIRLCGPAGGFDPSSSEVSPAETM